MTKVVVVFQGQNELEAQMARDVLQSAMIPVLHLPSLSTGVFGTPMTTTVAVPEEYVEPALDALEEAGLAGSAAPPPSGVAAFGHLANRLIPMNRDGVNRLTALRLAAALGILAIAVIVLIVYLVTRS